MPHTCLDLIQQQQLRAQDKSQHYEHNLAATVGTCLRCRAEGKGWEHSFATCNGRFKV